MDFKKQDPLGLVAADIETASGNKCEPRTIVVAEVDHAIVTWRNQRRTWEYWHQEDGGWRKVGSYQSAARAKAKAVEFKAERLQAEHIRSMGDVAVMVIAEWMNPFHGAKPIEVMCSTPGVAEDVAGVFNKIGCSTALRPVSA